MCRRVMTDRPRLANQRAQTRHTTLSDNSETFCSVELSLTEEARLIGRKHEVLRPQKPLRNIMDRKAGILFLTLTRYTVTTKMTLH